jgi:hypothetical protein
MGFQNLLQLGNFLLLVRLALVAFLYLIILQVVGVARRDLRRLAVVPAGVTRSGPIVGHLVVIDTGSTNLQPGARLELAAMTSIGRAPTNNVVLESTFVSTAHTRVSYKDGSLWVEDLGSRNGTKVNGQPVIQPLAVKPNDILEVGDVRFKFAV